MQHFENTHRKFTLDHGPVRDVRFRNGQEAWAETYRCGICGRWVALDVRINRDWRYRLAVKCCHKCETSS